MNNEFRIMRPSEKRHRSIRRIYGCSHAELLEVGREVSQKFQVHRCKARARGVEFRLTLLEWWKIWTDSGHWDDRSVTGYVMCRYGDAGAYEVGNVRIATAAENYADRRAPRAANRTVHSVGVRGFPPRYFLLRKDQVQA